MNGIDYLLDTNFILGLLKSSDETLEQISKRRIESQKCAYSAVSRMELLAFPGITPPEETLIQEKLAHFTYLPITSQIEDITIQLRRNHKIKLPDAIIAASALSVGAKLMTFDQQLNHVMANLSGWHENASGN